jgi:hypothetical protein
VLAAAITPRPIISPLKQHMRGTQMTEALLTRFYIPPGFGAYTNFIFLSRLSEARRHDERFTAYGACKTNINATDNFGSTFKMARHSPSIPAMCLNNDPIKESLCRSVVVHLLRPG